jgi:hypothetical protein
LEAVVSSHPGALAQWEKTKHPEYYPTARFHAAFWGKGVEAEERKWRNAQPPIPENQDEGGDMKDDLIMESESRPQDEDMDVEDDIISGC